ncbi:MAG: hypothetical protein A2X48_13030 [Lentisphaerae bacterium GWF2_49_21]|nr:MAG: hypothetical protein A2X48_13030 [Lentisphaerae bacterium GWF2_49_21]
MNKLLKEIYNMDKAAMKKAAENVMVGGGTRGGPILARGKGVRVWDIDDNEYIDCTSQSWALYLGYANDEINDIVRDHIENLTHIHQGFDSKPRFYLSQRLAQLAPEGMNRVSFTVGGGPAVEAAMKICAKNVPHARDFVCLYDSYHGTSLGSMGASWISTKANGEYMGGTSFLSLTRPFIRVPNPYTYRNPYNVDAETYIDMCLTMTREVFQRGIAGRPVGVLIEPIQASGGQIILPKRYLQEMRKLCNEFETLMVFDEIQTFGRIGEMFAADYFGVTPDIIVIGKALGGGFPLAGIIISDQLEGFTPNAEELHTFANPTASFVASARLLELLEEWVLENCRNMGAYLNSKLHELAKDYPEMGDIRQAGLHIGVEFVADPKTKETLEKETVDIRNAGMKNGIIFGLGGVRRNVLKIKPPLIVSQQECDEILEKLEKSMKSVLRR